MQFQRGATVLLIVALLGAVAPMKASAEAGDERRLGIEFETRDEMVRNGSALAMRFDLGSGSSYANAAAQARMLKQNSASLPGAGGTWSAVDNGPVIMNDPGYTHQNQMATGVTRASGRVTDFAYDAEHDRIFAALGHGGVWLSTDGADSWRAVGESLPTQTIGAVAYTPAGGGTLIALTGDNSTGSTSEDAGLGIFWSTDLGGTWHKATGAPDGVLGFRLAVRDDAPSTVYAATGTGLFRSVDAGRSWVDTLLPTGSCAGRSGEPNCFLANMVTDVQVRSADHFGHNGGAVVAAVGWVDGPSRNFAGVPEATGNGIYTSPTGAVGSFHRAGVGLPGPDVMGRTALGAATGPDQNHNFVYALVQDSKYLSPRNTTRTAKYETAVMPTYLKGVYVSRDFGEHWSLMEDRNGFNEPVDGSTLSALGPGAGIQAWYNEWITPDPTAQVNGVPTNLFVGLEEVWQSATVGSPQIGPTKFYAVAPYSNLGASYAACLGLVVASGHDCKKLAGTRPPTAHPDGHAGIVLPGRAGGRRPVLLIGTDGGPYRATIPSTGLIPHGAFGNGRHAGLNTLIAYSVAPSADGTVYAGLQDNGTVMLSPHGHMKPVEVFGGDGTAVLTDPHDASQAVFEPPQSDLYVSHDFGKTNADVEPAGGVRAKQWLTPVVLDELDPKRMLYGARDLYAADGGLAKLSSTGWHKVYDLGTSAHPGNPNFGDTAADPSNTASAMALRGGIAYVGFCALPCTAFHQRKFSTGIATNVGGRWHIAAATGLPHRMIAGVAIDPDDPRTVYAALGTTTASRWIAPGALGPEGVDADSGHVYRSTDGGESFTDISGALPKVGATAVVVHGNQLVVATAVGVFVSASRSGAGWAALGSGMPAANVTALAPDPADPNAMYAATYGRGIWRYRFGG